MGKEKPNSGPLGLWIPKRIMKEEPKVTKVRILTH